MTQTNNEREAFELSISMEYEHPTDLTRDGDGYSDGYVDNAWWGWCKALHYSKSPISQNEQQEPFGYFKAEPFGWTDCAETEEGAIPLYESPPKQAIPEGWKLVPIEPTERMLDVGESNYQYGEPSSYKAGLVYKAMLNAAPTNTEVGND